MADTDRELQRRGGTAPSGDAVYAMGMIGAWVYFWRLSNTTGERVLAVLKGFVWPAFLVYEAFAAVAGRDTDPREE